jgi:hypothetical protein
MMGASKSGKGSRPGSRLGASSCASLAPVIESHSPDPQRVFRGLDANPGLIEVYRTTPKQEPHPSSRCWETTGEFCLDQQAFACTGLTSIYYCPAGLELPESSRCCIIIPAPSFLPPR